MQLCGTDTEDVATIFDSRTAGTGERFTRTLNGFSASKHVSLNLHWDQFPLFLFVVDFYNKSATSLQQLL